MKRKILGLLLVFCMLATFLPCVHASEIIASGTCGDNLTWTLNSKGTLTIGGEGEMEDFWTYSGAPWYFYRNSITNIVIGDGVTSIGEYAFYGSQFRSINIPDNVKKIGWCAFGYTAYFKDDNNWKDNALYIDDILIGLRDIESESYSVQQGTRRIISGVFYDNKMLKSITIPDSVEIIDAGAFVDTSSYNSKLKIENIILSEGNTSFCLIDGALYSKDMSKLIAYPVGRKDTEYIVPDGVREIESYSFFGNENIKKITIPDSVSYISDDAFRIALTICGKTGSYAEKFADEYTNYMFDDIDTDGDVDNGTCGDNARYTLFEDGLLRISGYGDMYNYASMGDFYWLAPWFQVISDYVDMPTGITRVEIADDITSLGEGSLSFSNIAELHISKNITNIAYDALQGCDLEHITVDENNSLYCAVDDVLFSKDMKFLHTYARNKNEQYYTIPDGVEEINKCAFWGSLQLSSIMFPKTIKKINSRAFVECSSVSDIYFEGAENEWKLIDIGNYGNTVLENATIHYNATGINPPQIAGIPTVKDNGDGTYTVNMQIENVEYDSELIAALYDNGVMTGITSTIINADNIPETIIANAEDADTARLFIWSSIDGLQPLCKIVDAEFIKE